MRPWRRVLARAGAASIRHCFPSWLRGAPDIIAGEIDVLPAERREMGEKVIGNVLGLAQGGDGAFEIPCVPQDDRGDEKVEAGGAVLLVFVGAVADFAEPMNEDGAGQAVARLALVELAAGVAPQLRVFDPIEREQRALQPAQLAQRRGDAVLPRIGGQLAHDQRRRYRAGPDRGGDPQDFRPVGADQRDVDAAGDQRFERRIGRRLGEAVEPAVLQIRDARRELKAEQGAEREDVIGIAAAVGVVAADRDLALVIKRPSRTCRASLAVAAITLV